MNDLCRKTFSSIKISGGLRFLPIFGKSGSGKSSATLEISTHISAYEVKKLTRDTIYNPERLEEELVGNLYEKPQNPVIAVVDQFEETAADKQEIPRNFVEKLAFLYGTHQGRPVLVVWLTTDRDLQKQLEAATSRRERLLLERNFEIIGPYRTD